MKLCAIVPSYNHHRVVGEVVRALRAADIPVFLIDDGSAEETRLVLSALAGPGVTVHRLPQNGGKGAAVLTGFRLARAEGYSHALQVDADGQHDLTRLEALIATSKAEPTALVSGQPRYDASIPTGRKIGRWITHVWVWIETLSLSITDSMCGFRIYPLEATERLMALEPIGHYMDFDTDIMVRLFWRGTPVVMVPVDVTYPPDNTSNFAMVRDNVRISLMHTRLVFGMLARLPRFILRRGWA